MSCRVPTVRSMCSISIDVSPRICCRHDDVDPQRQPRGEPALPSVLPSVRSMVPGLCGGWSGVWRVTTPRRDSTQDLTNS